MKEIRLRARAKINLTLDVTGKREDGYHELRTIMQTVNLQDGIYMKKIDKPVIRVKSNWEWLPTDERNLAYRGAQLMRDTFGIQEGVFIELQKHIPVAAGLAGGSADCAAVLVGMNRLFGLRQSRETLMKMAAKLGSDIPYCILRGTALAEGIGDVITPVTHPFPPCFLVLVKPAFSVSTAYVYQHLRLDEIKVHPNTEEMLRAISRGDLHTIAHELCNVLETVTIPKHPQIGEIKDRMKALGALGTLMSGSGPTVFGLFDKEEIALSAAGILKQEFGIKDVFVTETFQNAQRGGETI
ncbi:MAG: 4-(cytidine 5'-diphospho)-2-C-methyl-D-erythritol kinase [Epulopiscium sp.]|jgi:4-diphosphocytidyl-2-C-methyl-D-erythritol kinase|nr:4-(cytidine 5'-diphospho)-2-C-methyl-D-erythritol kinase [Candidatus Epulonipiscium sp.]